MCTDRYLPNSTKLISRLTFLLVINSCYKSVLVHVINLETRIGLVVWHYRSPVPAHIDGLISVGHIVMDLESIHMHVTSKLTGNSVGKSI